MVDSCSLLHDNYIWYRPVLWPLDGSVAAQGMVRLQTQWPSVSDHCLRLWGTTMPTPCPPRSEINVLLYHTMENRHKKKAKKLTTIISTVHIYTKTNNDSVTLIISLSLQLLHVSVMVPLSCNNSGPLVHGCASVTMQYNLVAADRKGNL